MWRHSSSAFDFLWRTQLTTPSKSGFEKWIFSRSVGYQNLIEVFTRFEADY